MHSTTVKIARVFVDLPHAGLALLAELLNRLPDAAEQLEHNRGRDIGHDAQAEDGHLTQVGGGENGDLFQEGIELIPLPPPEPALTIGRGI